MFTHYRVQGIVLKKENIREADQLFTVFTKEFGRIEVLGRSIRKIVSKLRSAIELFYYVEIEFIQGKTYKILTRVIVIDKHANLRQNLKQLCLAYKVADIFDKLIIGQEKDQTLWQLFANTFGQLNKRSKFQVPSSKFYNYFLWQLLVILGYDPEHIKKQNISLEGHINSLLIRLPRREPQALLRGNS